MDRYVIDYINVLELEELKMSYYLIYRENGSDIEKYIQFEELNKDRKKYLRIQDNNKNRPAFLLVY